MKIEELTQDKLDELLAENESSKTSIKGLKADILALKQKAKGAEIDPAEHAALQSQVEELTSKLGKVEKDSKSAIDKLTAEGKTKDEALHKHLIEGSLTGALAKAGVKPEFMDASMALLKGQAIIKSENGNHTALIGDKPLADAVGEWAASDAGKHFVAAPSNGGGGAGGGSGSGKATAGKIDGTPQERAAYFASKYPELNKQE